MKIERLHPRAASLMGFIPQFLEEADPRPAAEQFNEAYAHGGGWRAFGKGEWIMHSNGSIQYPEDPPYNPVARITLREETIYVYLHAWVAIVQPNGDFEVARMD